MKTKAKNQNTGYSELLQELDLTCSTLASEIRESRSKGSVLGDDKKLDNILKVLDKASKIKALMAKEPDTSVKGEKEEVETVTTTVTKKRNIQDFVLKKDNE